jgi:LCP family protein required for cell wall assembly
MLDSVTPPKSFKKLFRFRRDKQPDFEIKPQRISKKKIIILAIIIIILLVPAFYILKTSAAFSKIITIKNIAWEKIFGKIPSSEYTPPKDPDRINALLLGIKGEGDPDGGWLADGIMIASLQKSTGKVALISMPRDLYLQLPGEVSYEKINTAYVIGSKKYENGLDYAKKTVAYVTGLHIDNAIVINFQAVKDIIELLGGVKIYLNQPFIEDKQWGCDKNGNNCIAFNLSAGEHVLNGDSALLYVRSRYSSTDFDRARRQQQVLLAIKDKALSLGVLADPLKISGIIDVLSKNVRTDVSPWQIPEIIKLANKVRGDTIIKKVFESSPEGLLYETKINGIYVLLPTQGNFDKIREACQNIFQ